MTKASLAVQSDTIAYIRLLASAWLLEPDEQTLRRLRVQGSWPSDTDEISPDEAALEYSQLILQQVPPYASLFLSEDGMLNGPYAEQVQLDYLQHDFEIDPAWRAGAPDHIGVELLFLAHLLEHQSTFQVEFLESRMLNWIPVCCFAIERNRKARLYAAIACATVNIIRSPA